MQENVKMFKKCVKQFRGGGMSPDPHRITAQTQFGRTTFQLPATALKPLTLHNNHS